LPEESAEDITDTAKLVRELKDYPVVIIPLLFVPVTTTKLGESKRFSFKKMLKEHTLLLHEVLKHNEGLTPPARYQFLSTISGLLSSVL
jgi:hypothetical protein